MFALFKILQLNGGALLGEAEEIDKEVQHALKILKTIGDTAKRQYETHLHMALVFRSDLITRKSDAWHQLALQSIERVNYDEALRRFAKAKSLLNATNQPLTHARILRDEAWLLAYHYGDLAAGSALVSEALACHERDLENARAKNARTKGRRQELVTQTYAWRIQYLATGSEDALSELVRIIEHEGHEFCDRDQLVIIQFLVPHVGIEERMRLQLRASQLASSSGSILSLPYRTALRSVTFGLSSVRWLGRIMREE